MSKIIAALLLASLSVTGFSQGEHLVLKRHRKAVRYYWNSSIITFRTGQGPWITGVINSIGHDSIYVRPFTVHFGMYAADTTYFNTMGLLVTEISALPSRHQMVSYRGNNPHLILGHEKFAWLRNGRILQYAGGGFLILRITNDLVSGSPPFATNKVAALSVGAAAFVFGTLLHLRFSPEIAIGKRYRLELVTLGSSGTRPF